MAANREDYKYMEIRDAIACINQKVSLFAVVLEFGLPKMSKGTDWFCTLKIIDESHPQPGLSVNFFAKSPYLLPHIASAGDIIQLSCVMMRCHNGEVNAVYDKRLSSFALYEGKEGTDFCPYQSSSTFRSRDLDSNFVADLRKWLSHFQPDVGSSRFLFLRDIKEGQVDLVCKVLHVYEVTKNEWMTLVWDGTDSAPISIKPRLEDEMDNPLPLQLEALPLSRDILCTFPTVGTVLRVIIQKDNQKHVLQMLNPGKWIKFVNISCETQSGLWRGVLTPFTKIRYTPNEDCLVLARQKAYHQRLSLKLGRIPHWCFPWCSRITEVDYDRVSFVTLMDILTYKEVTSKFKCVVRVVAVYPHRVQDFSYNQIYRFRLTIEDPTARIHAFVYGEDGEKFFGGHPSVEVLTRKRNKLLGVAINDYGEEVDAPRNPPWVQCCIKSYINDIQGSRNYRIFGTKLAG